MNQASESIRAARFVGGVGREGERDFRANLRLGCVVDSVKDAS